MTDDGAMTIGQLLRDAMDQKALSEARLGERLINDDTKEPAAQSRVHDWINGRALPSRPYFKSIGKVLGMSAQDVAALIGTERRGRSKGANTDRLDQIEKDVAELKRTLREIRSLLVEGR